MASFCCILSFVTAVILAVTIIVDATKDHKWKESECLVLVHNQILSKQSSYKCRCYCSSYDSDNKCKKRLCNTCYKTVFQASMDVNYKNGAMNSTTYNSVEGDEWSEIDNERKFLEKYQEGKTYECYLNINKQSQVVMKDILKDYENRLGNEKIICYIFTIFFVISSIVFCVDWYYDNDAEAEAEAAEADDNTTEITTDNKPMNEIVTRENTHDIESQQ